MRDRRTGRWRRVAGLALSVALLSGCTEGGGQPVEAVPGTLRPTSAAVSEGAPPAAGSPSEVVRVFDEVPALHPSVDDYAAGFVDVHAPDGTTHRVAVRLATTSEQRAHGLMEVEQLPEGAGMWFVYEEDRTGPFWMKHTLVPLDIAYVGEDDRIVSVADAVPCESEPCPTYPPEGVYHNVLEVPNGWLASIGVGPGDVVRLVDP